MWTFQMIKLDDAMEDTFDGLKYDNYKIMLVSSGGGRSSLCS
jgi:hypothetical protein